MQYIRLCISTKSKLSQKIYIKSKKYLLNGNYYHTLIIHDRAVLILPSSSFHKRHTYMYSTLIKTYRKNRVFFQWNDLRIDNTTANINMNKLIKVYEEQKHVLMITSFMFVLSVSHHIILFINTKQVKCNQVSCGNGIATVKCWLH